MKEPRKTPPSSDSSDGVIIQASNGDVIRYDETGLVLRLSDQVLADIAMRMGVGAGVSAAPTSPTMGGDVQRVDPHDYIPGLEAWGMTLVGDWLYFTADLPGKQGVRGFLRAKDGGHIIADTSGPVLGILGLGGPRAALAMRRISDYPQHILCPDDDIGAVGHAGIETASETAKLGPLREVTHEAIVAENLLSERQRARRNLALFVTRVETDNAASSQELADGTAVKNLRVAARNLANAAHALGKPASVVAVTLDYTFEDQSGSSTAYRDGMMQVMENTASCLGDLGFHSPRFLARFDNGTAELNAPHVIDGQWELGWNHGDHAFTYTAPSYMFDYDDFDRATDAARQDMADMTAAAINDADWHCPTFLLAERLLENPNTIRVTTKSLENLVIDPDAPFDTGAAFGFTLMGDSLNGTITDVVVDPDDPKSLLLTCDGIVEDGDTFVAYAYGETRAGAVRDTWGQTGVRGQILHRWALPCYIPLTLGGAKHVEG